MKPILLKIGLTVLLLAIGIFSVRAQDVPKHAVSFNDLISLHRISGPTMSADGKWIAFAVSTPDMEKNRGVSNIWIVPAVGGTPLQLTQSGRDSSPAWSPDGKTIAFLSARGGESQVYLLSMEGGEAHAITHISTGADMVKWSPDGKTIAFTSSAYPRRNKKRTK
jgi:Tol biopolymer transport system component